MRKDTKNSSMNWRNMRFETGRKLNENSYEN